MSEPARPRFRRVRIAATSLLTLVVVIVGLLQLPPVATWVARRLVRFVPLSPGYTLDVGRVSGNWFGELELRGVVLSRAGRELARIDRLGLRYSLGELTGAPVRVREIDVESARATARRELDGWDLANALRKSADTTTGGGFAVGVIDVRNVALVAELSPDSLVRVRGLAMRVHDLDMGAVITARVERLSLALAPPASPTWFAISASGEATPDLFAFEPVRIQTERSDVTGRIVLPRRLDETALLQRLDLRLKAAPLALADLSPLFPSVAPDGSLNLEAKASAQGRVVTARLDAEVGQGTLSLTGSTELVTGTPSGYRVHGTMRHLDPSKLSSSSPAGSINGTIDGELSGSRDSARGSAKVRIADSRVGTTPIEKLDLDAVLAAGDSLPEYRLAGVAAGSALDVRFTLAGSGFAPATAHLTGRLDVAARRGSDGPLPVGHATLSLEKGHLIARPDLTVGGGRITALATAHFGDTVTYRLSDGTIAGVDLGRLMGDTLVAPLNGRFSLSGTGTTPAGAIVVAELRFDEVRYGARRVDSVVAGARLDRGRA